MLIALLLCASHAVRADDAAALLARYKAASGGARWDSLTSQQSSGTLSAGGLSGEFESLQDLATGRTASHYRLGPIEGAQGYDGALAWQRDPGGEVATLDAAEAKRRARSQAWLDARAYWYPARIEASYGQVEQRDVDGKTYTVVEATPQGGDALGLWFDATSHLLTRTVQQQGQDTMTTTYADWREVDGLRLAFHITTDRTDAAGRTDPRATTEVRIDKVARNVAVTDADFAVPAMTATAHIEGDTGIARIPFDLVNNHIYVDGAIDGKRARFLVDTGGVNLLTPAAAKKFRLVGQGKLAARGVGDETVDLALAHAKEVRVGAAVLAKPVFYVIDLGDLPKVEGIAFDGLVGYEMFRRFGVTIDYAGRELSLAEPAKFTPPAGAHAVSFELDERIPLVNGTLDGQPVRLSIDTGSRVSLTLHSPFVRERGLVAGYDAAPEAVIGWGVGGPSRGRPARFGTLRLGDVSIDGIAGDLYTGNKGAFATPDIAGNLGGGVLKRFTVAFDYTARRMYLAPNATSAAPDPFDRSGLWLLGDGDTLEVSDVAPESAAARAGMQAGDRITAIDDERIAKRGLGEWRQRLRELPVGTKLAVDYRRDDASARTELVLADRIPMYRAANP
jgi:predicted aspartyl protease